MGSNYAAAQVDFNVMRLKLQGDTRAGRQRGEGVDVASAQGDGGQRAPVSVLGTLSTHLHPNFTAIAWMFSPFQRYAGHNSPHGAEAPPSARTSIIGVPAE